MRCLQLIQLLLQKRFLLLGQFRLQEGASLAPRFWIRDPQNGINNIGSEVMFTLWDKFKEHGIDLPLGQDEVRIVADSELKVKLVRDRGHKSDEA